MPTDDERREAAGRLEGYVSEWRDMPSFSVQKGVACSLGIARFDVESQLLRLADLIDPDCEEGRYSVARTARPVDREALLALADEMDRDGKMQRERQKTGGHWFIDGLDVREYARRIREALGVSGDE